MRGSRLRGNDGFAESLIFEAISHVGLPAHTTTDENREQGCEIPACAGTTDSRSA